MRSHVNFKTLVLLAVAVAGITYHSDAAIITVPPGLNPGDTYRLVFATSTTHDALSSDIGFYNDWVSALASSSPGLSALGATWYAIGSTATVDAIDNIGVSGPSVGIYLLNGVKFADGTEGLFGGSVVVQYLYDNEFSEAGIPLLIPAFWHGTCWNTGRITGCPDYPYHPLGAWPMATGSGGNAFVWESHRIYGISSAITVGEPAVPEPASIGLTTLGGAMLLFAIRRRRKDPLAIPANRTPPVQH